ALAGLLSSVAVLSACSPAAPLAPPPVASASAPPPAPPARARWGAGGGQSRPGGPVAATHTLAPLAGTRHLAGDDGKVTRANGTESLDGLVRVPHAGGLEIVGHRGGEIVRFDGALGPERRIAVVPHVSPHIGTWPDRLHVRTWTGEPV